MVAAELRVAVQHERDVAVGTAQRRPARAAVQRRRDTAAVQEEDRLRAALGDAAQLGEQRRGEWITRFAAEVDDPHRRQLGADPAAQRQPFERRPALGPRRRGAEDGGGALERGPLDRDGARVVARVGVLLVGLVVLLVDHDQPEALERREDGRARADDHSRLTAHDPLALVAALGFGQCRVEHRDAVAEARAEAADGLRGERDLRHEHDRTQAPLERRRARLQIDLRLPRPRDPVEQEVAAAGVDRRDEPLDRRALGR